MLYLLGRLTVEQKLEACRTPNDHSAYIPWLISIAVAITTIIIAWVIWQKVSKSIEEKKKVENFNSIAEKEDLTPAEIAIAKIISGYSYANGDLEAVMTLEAVFEDGVNCYLRSSDFVEKNLIARREIIDSIRSLKSKLKISSSDESDFAAGSRIIEAQDKVTLILDTENKTMQATVTKSTTDRLALSVNLQVEEAIKQYAQMHETVIIEVQYFDGNNLWSFNLPIVSAADKTIILTHADSGEVINRRRFNRFRVDYSGKIARYDFSYKSNYIKPVTWHDAKLVELAGPGLKFRIRRIGEDITKNKIKKGDAFLVSTQIRSNKIIQHMGIVRRVTEKGLAYINVVVELTNLQKHQLSELTQATNHAAFILKNAHHHELETEAIHK